MCSAFLYYLILVHQLCKLHIDILYIFFIENKCKLTEMKYAAQSFRDSECRNVLHFFIQQMDMMGAESQTLGTMYKREKKKAKISCHQGATV